MEQYEKSGPKKQRPAVDQSGQEIKSLEQVVKEQGQQIEYLKKEIVRMKRKMDAHAAVVNKINNG